MFSTWLLVHNSLHSLLLRPAYTNPLCLKMCMHMLTKCMVIQSRACGYSLVTKQVIHHPNGQTWVCQHDLSTVLWREQRPGILTPTHHGVESPPLLFVAEECFWWVWWCHSGSAPISTGVSKTRAAHAVLWWDTAELGTCCLMANTAFVWLVGTSTLHTIPSQQEIHSWEERFRAG